MSLVLFTEGTARGETSGKLVHRYIVKYKGETNMGRDARGRKRRSRTEGG